MTAISSTKTLRASVATALALGTLAATPAFAQFTTSGTYVPTGADASARTATPATGNSESLAVFQANILAAGVAGTGGDITFDNATIANGTATVNTTTLTATYGVTQGSTLTITQPLPIAFDPATTNSPGSYSTGLDAANVTSAGANANYLGFSNIGSNPTAGGATNSVFNFAFSQNLSDFGIMVINRAAARPLTFTVSLSNGTTVTPTTAFATSNGTLSFFEYAATGAAKITGVTFSSTGGYTRFDDLGFVVAAPAAAPEPSQVASLGLGVMGLGLLALKARKRVAADS